MSNEVDPIASLDPAEVRRRLDETRAAFLQALDLAKDAIAAADAAGDPRDYGVTNRELHIAEAEAIATLREASDQYGAAIQARQTLSDWPR